MLANEVDVEFSVDDMKAVMEALEIVRAKMSFLVGLSTEERRRLSKIGTRSQTFTHQALAVAAQHPELMPRYLDVDGAMRDMNLFIALNPILQTLIELQRLVNVAMRDMNLFIALNPILQTLIELQRLVKDTQTVAGSEAYAAARTAYTSAKKAAKGMGLEDVVETLSQHFERSRPAAGGPSQAGPSV
jgi:pimeloyl-ACP methyl ester carboxylesterase